MIQPTDLNDKEFGVMRGLIKASEGQGHDFGFTDGFDAKEFGITEAQRSGYVSQLIQKGYIDNGFTHHDPSWKWGFQLTKKGAELAGIELNYEGK